MDRNPSNETARFAPDDWQDPSFPVYSDQELPSFVGSTTFLKLQLVDDVEELLSLSPDIAIVGVPFDDGVSHRPGARFGPRAIRAATYVVGQAFPSLQHGMLEPLSVLHVVDAGDANIVPSWHTRGHAMIYQKIREVCASGAIPVILGGDHSITWPCVTALAESIHPRTVGIVHFDAHADTVVSNWGQPPALSGHGTPMRRLLESGAVLGTNFVQIGLRGYWPPREVFEWMTQQGMRYHLMTDIDRLGLDAILEQAITQAGEGCDAVYLSVDIDVVDPGAAPGTGAPESGGLSGREILRAVRKVVGSVEVAGVDIVEVAPAYDVAEVTSTLANRIVMEVLSSIAARRR